MANVTIDKKASVDFGDEGKGVVLTLRLESDSGKMETIKHFVPLKPEEDSRTQEEYEQAKAEERLAIFNS